MSWPKRNQQPVNTDKSDAPNPALTDDNNPETGAPLNRVAGMVFPYRGQEQHGVAMDQAPYSLGADILDYQATEYVEPTPLDDPIPVRIVGQDSREIRSFAATQTIADGIVRIVAGDNERRRKVTIRNMDTAKRVYIGNDLTLGISTGYPLDFGATISLECETAVYAISADGTQVIIAVLVEKTIAAD